MTIQVSAEAFALHKDAFVADLHVDSFLVARQFGYDFLKRHSAWLPLGAFFSHADLPRMEEGGVDLAAFGAVVFPLARECNNFPSAKRQIALFHDACARSGGRLVFAGTPDEALKAKRDGKRCGFIGIEGAHALGGDLRNVEEAFKLGARYITLAHFSSNKAARCMKGLGADKTSGLTGWGRELVGEMNRLGIMVDVAHVNKPGFLEAVVLSKMACLVSHAGVRGAYNSFRSVDDEMLRALADRGGALGVIFGPMHTTPSITEGARAIFRHIDHVVKTVGDEHASLGSDFDGYVWSTPHDLRDMAATPVVTQLMLENGYSEERIRRILGLNFLRVWRENAI
jgi:membrane dipeptidase